MQLTQPSRNSCNSHAIHAMLAQLTQLVLQPRHQQLAAGAAVTCAFCGSAASSTALRAEEASAMLLLVLHLYGLVVPWQRGAAQTCL